MVERKKLAINDSSSDNLAVPSYGTLQPEYQQLGSQKAPDISNENNERFGSDTLTAADHRSQSMSVSSRPNFVILLMRPRMLVAILGSFMDAFVVTELESILPLYIKRLFGFNSKDVGLIYLFLMLAYFSAPFVGTLCDRIGAKALVTTGFVLLTPSWILLQLVNHDSFDQIVLLCILLTTIGIALNLIIAPVYTEAKATVDEIQEEEVGIFGEKGAYAMGFALMNMAYAVGSLLGPILGSLLMERIGWQRSTLLVGILCGLCIFPSVYFLGGRRQKKSMIRNNEVT